MAKKIEGKDFYVPVKPYEHAGQTFDVLSVCATYRKGEGFYVYFKPGWRTGWGGYGCILMGTSSPLEAATWVLVMESARNSQKIIDEMADNLEQAKGEIATLFNERNFEGLKSLLKDVALHGYPSEFMSRTADETTNNNINNNIQNQTTMATVKQNETMNAAQQQVTNNNAIAEQFAAAKKKGTVLLFTRGDEYVCLFEDAREVARLMGKDYQTEGGIDILSFPKSELPKVVPMIVKAGLQVSMQGELADVPAADATAEPEQTAKEDGVEVRQVDVMGLMADLKKNGTARLSDHGTLVVGGVSKPETAKVEPIVVNTSAEEEKPKVTLRRKNSRQGGYKVVTMAAKRGGVSSKLYGFASEKEAKALADKMANSIRCTWDYGAEGEGRESKTRHYYLWLGTRYVDVAQELCRALNEGDKVAVAQAAAKSHEVYAGAVAENQGQRKPTAATPAADQPQRDGRITRSGKTYTEAEVLDLLNRIGNREAAALAELAELQKKAA